MIVQPCTVVIERAKRAADKEVSHVFRL